MLIRSQNKYSLIDVTDKRLEIAENNSKWYIIVREMAPDSNKLALFLGCYPTEEKALQVLNDIEIAWSKWTPSSPAYHMPDENGVIDISDVEKAEAMQKYTAQTPELYGDGYVDGYLVYDEWKCPGCGESYETDGEDYNYCPNCGQKIDWSEFKEWKD